MMFNICMKFHEDILNSFKFNGKTYYFQFQRAVTPKIQSYGSLELHVI